MPWDAVTGEQAEYLRSVLDGGSLLEEAEEAWFQDALRAFFDGQVEILRSSAEILQADGSAVHALVGVEVRGDGWHCEVLARQRQQADQPDHLVPELLSVVCWPEPTDPNPTFTDFVVWEEGDFLAAWVPSSAPSVTPHW